MTVLRVTLMITVDVEVVAVAVDRVADYVAKSLQCPDNMRIVSTEQRGAVEVAQ